MISVVTHIENISIDEDLEAKWPSIISSISYITFPCKYFEELYGASEGNNDAGIMYNVNEVKKGKIAFYTTK